MRNFLRAIIIILIFLIVSYIFYGCAATTNCYTAKTLPKHHKALTPGLDYIAFWGNHKFMLSFPIPSVGMAYGLTDNFEIGLRGYFPYTLEGSFRVRLNPKTFSFLDISGNLHFGTFKLIHYPFLKYGITIGKSIKKYQPFISYYFYRFYEPISLFDEENIVTRSNYLCFGVGLPFKKNDLIIPEINYRIPNNGFNSGVFFLSIGIRAID